MDAQVSADLLGVYVPGVEADAVCEDPDADVVVAEHQAVRRCACAWTVFPSSVIWWMRPVLPGVVSAVAGWPSVS